MICVLRMMEARGTKDVDLIIVGAIPKASTLLFGPEEANRMARVADLKYILLLFVQVSFSNYFLVFGELVIETVWMFSDKERQTEFFLVQKLRGAEECCFFLEIKFCVVTIV
mmetsp:Transcript_25636/g.37880  ORF Transcript_25636/g.37880 Transcript_25636/m.37880 type:complete len:112 (-) Transcript_25636:22-357(-)